MQSAAVGKSEAFLRVLYQMQSQLGAFGPGKFKAGANPAATRAQQVRVPTLGLNPEQALLFWTRFFLTHVDAAVPLLLVLPLDAEWLDVTAGEPESHEFFSLRASPRAVPLVSEVPYTLDDRFCGQATTFLDRFQKGETASVDFHVATAPALDAALPAKSGWRKWLGVGVILVLGALAAVFFLTRDGKEQTQTASAPQPSNPQAETKSQTQTPAPSVPEPPKAQANLVKAVANPAASLEEQRKLDAMAAAAKLKAEAENAAKEKERQAADAVRLAKEREIAKQKELVEQQRQAALAEQQRQAALAAAEKKKADDQARAKAEIVAVATPVRVATDTAPPKTIASVPQGPVVVRNEITNSIGMVLVPLGAKWSGTKMWVGKYEVTQAEYRKVMGSNPSGSQGEQQPVERVNWNEATEFCRKLTNLEQGKILSGKVYAFPTAKQWDEFLGGQRFEDLNESSAGSRSAPAVVGQSRPANKFGLFDVVGNVWEWCADGPAENTKDLRGGAFNNPSFNRSLSPDIREASCGFRCVLSGQ